MRYKNLRGVENVERIFSQLPRKNQEQITNALNQGAEEVKDIAVSIVPRDTGDLASDISVDTTGVLARDDDKGVVVRVIAGTTPGNGQAAFRSEFGRRPSGGHPGHSAQPFLFPAYWSIRKKIRARVQRAVRAAVKAVANG